MKRRSLVQRIRHVVLVHADRLPGGQRVEPLLQLLRVKAEAVG